MGRSPLFLLRLGATVAVLLGRYGVDSFAGTGTNFAQLASTTHDASLSSAAISRAATAQNDESASSSVSSTFAVATSELDDDLSEEEKTIINVYRAVGPSVAFVASFRNRQVAAAGGSGSSNANRRGRRRRRSTDEQSKSQKDQKNIKPDGTSLGSGSGFVVSEDGYIVSNYHVIERAYQLSTAVGKYNSQIDQLVGNVTASFGAGNPLASALEDRTKRALKVKERPDDKPRASVYVRINSSTKYQLCRIVDVRPDLDVAVLKVELSEGESLTAVPWGSSSKLLVGQRVVAIGNPFGLDQSLSAGVVSSLNREMQSIGGAKIQNCIQTDAAINPGNSGGPLLNSKGQLIGINTAIITTSGSSAGIGFAVPSDKVRGVIEDIVSNDRIANYPGRAAPGWLGADLASSALSTTLIQKYFPDVDAKDAGVFISQVQEGSPAALAGLTPLKMNSSGSVVVGDRIKAIGGREVSSRDDLKEDMKKLIVGEEIALTVVDGADQGRVVYVKLASRQNKTVAGVVNKFIR